MKFSLTTSFYNGEEFIRKLYKNIISQTYKNWEWIVTDDFSSDNTKEILLSICKKDRRVKYVEQSFKKEMFYNPQNFCKDSEIIVQLDSDDLMMPKALEVYYHFFMKFPNVILITCYSTRFMGDQWLNVAGSEITLDPNLSSGHQTYLRAWRNRHSLNLDFNPGNWMKYFYNDLSIVTKLEEHGEVLVLPRMLYHYSVRPDSISHKKEYDVFDVYKENETLISGVKNRRSNNQDFDTFERYFDPIYDITKGLTEYNLNSTSECLKISFYKTKLQAYQKKLIKQLYFDFDINFNDFESNSDYNIFFLSDEEDLEFSLNNLYNICDNSSGRTQIIVLNYDEKSQEFRDKLENLLLSKYRYQFFITKTHSPDYKIINIVK